jgi:hypothetical protein
LNVGSYLHESGILLASPDGESNDFTVEIKCLWSRRAANDLKISYLMPKRPSARYLVNYVKETNQWVLNKDHEYYHQMQAQMLFAKKQFGFFLSGLLKFLRCLKFLEIKIGRKMYLSCWTFTSTNYPDLDLFLDEAC